MGKVKVKWEKSKKTNDVGKAPKTDSNSTNSHGHDRNGSDIIVQ